MTVLSCHDLCSGYGAMQVVRNINLEVAAGEIVALLGRVDYAHPCVGLTTFPAHF